MKTDRLVSIIMILLEKERVSAQELADMFEVSLRTIYRDMMLSICPAFRFAQNPEQAAVLRSCRNIRSIKKCSRRTSFWHC